MLRLTLAIAIGLLTLNTAAMAESTELSGSVVKLAEKSDTAQPVTVNVGGLVIAVVRDSGSRPPQNMAVVASDSLQALGIVRGVQNDQGQALMGGGYTWHLFQPTKAGDVTVKVSYTENGDGGKRVTRDFKLSIE
jgi:hypothetical protein